MSSRLPRPQPEEAVESAAPARQGSDPTPPPARRRGRPKKPGEPQNTYMSVRLTQSNVERIRAMGGATWLREIIFKAFENIDGPNETRQNVKIKGRRILGLEPVRRENPKDAVKTILEGTKGDRSQVDDLNALLVPNPGQMILVEATGESMIDAGIAPKDLLIVDLSVRARSGQIVLATVDGNYVVRRLKRVEGDMELRSENDAVRQAAIRPTATRPIEILGVVRSVIHRVD
ncbi:LexA family transcriptional regulator [Sutterella sp.]|uniref:LexA family protein n=1 Tax=Sutterella sp. TaxID=1981025 RepID=UPI0026DFE056|nr:S24 family peptidase [Sutterella sp.]MDO5532106.1 S24 family peptidase [Sutterella sp.]